MLSSLVSKMNKINVRQYIQLVVADHKCATSGIGSNREIAFSIVGSIGKSELSAHRCVVVTSSQRTILTQFISRCSYVI